MVNHPNRSRRKRTREQKAGVTYNQLGYMVELAAELRLACVPDEENDYLQETRVRLNMWRALAKA